MDKAIDDFNRPIDKHEQYSHINCILVQVIKESENKDTNVV